jgi:uncharacterized membrane protein YcaP (DUF421 family)
VLFQNWDVVLRTLWIGTAAYIALILILRVSGKRTLSQLNAFDFVITVALGSTLASVLTSPNVALAEGVTALALLVALQYVATWTSVRVGWVRTAIRSQPSVLVYRGRLVDGALRRERLTEDEVRQVLRQQGHPDLETVGALVLETDGSFALLEEAPPDSSDHPEPRV